MDEEYELMPHKLLSDLKYDVESLKKKLEQPDVKINELILEIESMKDSIHDLNDIFKRALEETKEEDVYKKLNMLSSKVDSVASQNETIAGGMIAISEKLEEFMNHGNAPMRVSQPPQQLPPHLMSPQNDLSDDIPIKHDIGMPQPKGPGKIAPQPNMDFPPLESSNKPFTAPTMGEDNSFPPPPPMKSGSGDKKTLIGKLFGK